MLLYRGVELEHWSETLKVNYVVKSFFITTIKTDLSKLKIYLMVDQVQTFLGSTKI